VFMLLSRFNKSLFFPEFQFLLLCVSIMMCHSVLLYRLVLNGYMSSVSSVLIEIPNTVINASALNSAYITY
jgi:hypothetical protein